ncbi:universal stress protein [Streptomyces sp. HPF1205]|uniref:universal stress protein n=1 Tax=Streptomyces sp. HPF1205 TaxID=2873262 RepID=UPI001CEDFDB4|nr:universal stress protein [Streptomyces sp. HPF1205]
MPSQFDGANLTAEEVASEQLAGRERAQRIVVGVDGSFGSSTAVTWAAAQARERGAVLDLVAVWEELAARPPGAAADGHLAVARERLERAVQALARHRELPERVISAPVQGSPGEQLVARAEGASLLVLGTTGISSPEIPGGIGLYCLRHSTTPVVFVPLPPEP